MALDGKKLLEDSMAALLTPGEEVLGACKAAGKNVALASAIGGVAGAAVGGSRRTGGLSDAVPQDKIFWIGATTTRLVYFGIGVMSTKPKAMRGETPLNVIAAVQVTRNKLARRLDLSFTDGTSTTVDLYRASSPDSLQSALEQVLPGRVTEST